AEPVAALGALAVLAEIRERVPEVVQVAVPSLEHVLPDAAELPSSVGGLQNDTVARCVLAFLRAGLAGKWQEVYAAVLPSCSPGICEWIAQELSNNGHMQHLCTAADAILKRPEQHVSALVWLWKAVCAERFPEALAEVEGVALAVRLFSVADSLGRDTYRDKGRQRHLLSLVRGGISAKNYGLLSSVLGQADVNRVRSVRNVVERNAGLSEQACVRVLDIINKTCPELSARAAVNPWEDEAIYTTEEGLNRLHKEFAHLTQIEVPKNSREIGVAAARGDLSENAEFTAALEERDRLVGRAARMEAELAKARIIPASMAESSTVTVGSAVQVNDLATGELDTFVFLGPWDADPQEKIYSYRAPLSLAFMGKKVGDIAVFHTDEGERKWKIVEIRAGI
ncbi:MAG: GreA/GreB family elongation factor, partial [Planctomycetia bacterium]|nr:GreA/GreB family elongation factor [Planctomycetia bacterium]